MSGKIARLVVQARRARQRWDRGRASDVDLLEGSALFDHEWYSLLRGRLLERPEAVRDYLASSPQASATPHPLVAPMFMTRSTGPAPRSGELCRKEAYLAYVRRPQTRHEVHPLFNVAGYLEQCSEALHHEDGPLGHYLEVGAATGMRPNDWYRPRPSRQPRGLLDWVWRRAEKWVAHRGLEQIEAPTSATPVKGTLTVVVLVEGKGAAAHFATSIASLRAQDDHDLEVVAVGVGEEVDVRDLDAGGDLRVRLVPDPMPHRLAALNLGLAIGTGRWAAICAAGDTWAPKRWQRLRTALGDDGLWAADEPPAGGPPASRRSVLAGWPVDDRTLVLDRGAAVRAGGFDEESPRTASERLVLRLHDDSHRVPGPGFVPGPSVRPGTPAVAELEATLRGELGWEPPVGRRTRNVEVDVVIVARHMDEASSIEALATTLADEEARVVVVDTTTDVVSGLRLARVAAALGDQVVLVTAAFGNPVFAADVGIASTTAPYVALAQPGLQVEEGWWPLLREQLEDPAVAVARSSEDSGMHQLTAMRATDLREERGLDPSAGEFSAAVDDFEHRIRKRRMS